MKITFDAIKRFSKKQIKEFAKAILVAIPVFFIYINCTKIGSEYVLKTNNIDWYVPESEKSTEALTHIADSVLSTLNKKGIDTNCIEATIILCNSTNEFMWKSITWDNKIQGATRWQFKHIAINNCSIEENKMIGFDNSTLSDVITHEFCHIYLYKKLPFWDFIFLESWKNEGFCEYIADHSSIGIGTGLNLFLTSDLANKEDEAKYFYFKSRLKSDYLLGYKGISFEEFVDTKYDVESLENEIRTALKNGEYKFPAFTSPSPSSSFR